MTVSSQWLGSLKFCEGRLFRFFNNSVLTEDIHN